MADPNRPTPTQKAALVLLLAGRAHVGSTTHASPDAAGGVAQIHAGTASALQRMGYARVVYPRVELTERGVEVARVYRDRARQGGRG
jgi:hypothetical protein